MMMMKKRMWDELGIIYSEKERELSSRFFASHFTHKLKHIVGVSTSASLSTQEPSRALLLSRSTIMMLMVIKWMRMERLKHYEND